MRYASFYAGAGGFDLGVRLACPDARLALATDVDRDCVDTLARGLNFRGEPLVCADIEHMLATDFLNYDLLKQGRIDLVVGGPPCQGFSVAGYMSPTDPRSKHIFRFLDAVGKIRPTAFIMENVAGLGARRWHYVIERWWAKAEKLGYDIYAISLNAQDYGVAQYRQRMFFYGVPKGIRAPKTPKPTDPIQRVRNVLDRVPREMPDVIPGARITLAKKPVLRQSPYAGMLLNGAGRVIDLDKPSPTLPATMGGNRTPVIDLDSLEYGHVPWIVGYHSDLMADEPPLAAVPPHVRMRRMSMNEAIGIQGFPFDYPFMGNNAAKWRQIGNAVPPPLAQVVVSSIREVT